MNRTWKSYKSLLFFAEPEDGRSRERSGTAVLLDDRVRRKKESNAAIAAAAGEKTPFHVVKEAVRSSGGEIQNDSLRKKSPIIPPQDLHRGGRIPLTPSLTRSNGKVTPKTR